MAHDDFNLSAPSDTEARLAELERLARRNRKLGKAYFVIGSLSIFNCIFFQTFSWLEKHYHLPGALWWAFWLVSGGPYLCIVSAYTLEARRYNRRRRKLILSLSDDIRSVGPLLLLLHESQDKNLKALIHATLKTLLPRLRFSDARHFTSEQMTSLLGMLKPQAGSYDLRVAVVQALEQIGDSRAIVPLQAVAAEAIFPDLRLAAQTALDTVQAHAAEREKSVTLLRPSDPNWTTSDTLLRPAAAQSDAGPEQLLRPTQ